MAGQNFGLNKFGLSRSCLDLIWLGYVVSRFSLFESLKKRTDPQRSKYTFLTTHFFYLFKNFIILTLLIRGEDRSGTILLLVGLNTDFLVHRTAHRFCNFLKYLVYSHVFSTLGDRYFFLQCHKLYFWLFKSNADLEPDTEPAIQNVS